MWLARPSISFTKTAYGPLQLRKFFMKVRRMASNNGVYRPQCFLSHVQALWCSLALIKGVSPKLPQADFEIVFWLEGDYEQLTGGNFQVAGHSERVQRKQHVGRPAGY